MLALTRRIGEEVVIGDPRNPLGMIRVVDIHGDKVRLAFDFPRDCQINRRELAEQKARSADQPDHDPASNPKHPGGKPSDGHADDRASGGDPGRGKPPA